MKLGLKKVMDIALTSFATFADGIYMDLAS